jgi:hypothetical protein
MHDMIAKLAVMALNLVNIAFSCLALMLCGLFDAAQGNWVSHHLSALQPIVY